jgi:hypothetical protein
MRSLLLAPALLLMPTTVAGNGDSCLRLIPERIEMGSLYDGARVRVEGTVSHGSAAIVVIRGPDKEESFNRKARFGPIWATSGKIHISGAPSLFFCFSSQPAADLLDPRLIEERLLDEAAIQASLRVEPGLDPETEDAIRSDFLSLKQDTGLYQVLSDRVKIGAPDTSGVPFSVEFAWPKAAPPASYTVMLLECCDGQVVGEFSMPLEVVKTGFPESAAALATEHAAWYGFFAVLCAVCSGFAIDFFATRLLGRKRSLAH